MKKKSFGPDEHEEVGATLFRMSGELLTLSLKISSTYGKTKTYARKLFAAHWRLDTARYEMANVWFGDEKLAGRSPTVQACPYTGKARLLSLALEKEREAQQKEKARQG